MRFHLIDRIESVEPGKTLRGVKLLALGEEYLADHFPKFPIMPGVLMLQSVVEAAGWLWRATTDFRHPVIVLREVKSVKYGTFMQPGRRLEITAEMTKDEGDFATFRGKGVDDAGKQNVSASFVLHGYRLADRGPSGALIDDRLLSHWKTLWPLLRGELSGY